MHETIRSLRPGLELMRHEIGGLQQLLAARRQVAICRDVKHQLASVRFETAKLRHDLLCRKAGYKDDQPRWPGGTPGEPKPGGRWSGGAGTGPGRVKVTTSDGFLTGISTIDDTSKVLSETLVKVMEKLDFIPESSPQVYGIAVHTAFAWSVRLQDLPGIGYFNVERTFSFEDSDPRYGLAGSIRTDVVLEDDRGEVVAIYDVKTGTRELSRARADELRTMTGAAPNTPVFELHIDRGITRKSADIFCVRFYRSMY